MPASASATSVGARGASPSGGRPAGAKSSSSGLRQRKGASGAASGGSSGGTLRAKTNNAGMFRFYQEDSPGIKVGPVPVMVFSVLFIACVFLLHFWGKFTRG
jgi:preprotein translocase subunit Sec61beta